MINENSYNLDDEEKQILEAFEKGELRSNLKDPEKDLAEVIKAAENTLKKNRTVNIKISEVDLMKIKSKAYENGIPYQTLMGTILHQYANDRLTASL
jgi:predicted DNA binding CopG/RHH family protein